MTHAPADLLAVRQYLLTTTGLSGDAVGIVGDPAHASTGGYHEGNDDLARVGRLNTDYSKRESARDRPGSNAASALDIGSFSSGATSLRELSRGLVSACMAGDPRTRDIREVICTVDGRTVLRWDRLGIRSSGDSSHLFHTHISFFRDSEGRRAGADNVLGLLAELIEGVDVGRADEILADTIQLDNAVYSLFMRLVTGTDPYWSKIMGGRAYSDPVLARANLRALADRIDAGFAADAARDAAAKAAIDALAAALAAGGGSVDSAAIIARMDAIAAAESDAMGRVLAELASSRQEAALLREGLADRDARLAAALEPPAA